MSLQRIKEFVRQTVEQNLRIKDMH